MRDRSWTKRLGTLLAVGMIASACSTSSVSPSPAAPTGTTSAATPAASTDAGASAVSAAPATAAALKIPSAPVTINVLDVAGNLQLTKQMMENFKTAHPEIAVSYTHLRAHETVLD